MTLGDTRTSFLISLLLIYLALFQPFQNLPPNRVPGYQNLLLSFLPGLSQVFFGEIHCTKAAELPAVDHSLPRQQYPKFGWKPPPAQPHSSWWSKVPQQRNSRAAGGGNALHAAAERNSCGPTHNVLQMFTKKHTHINETHI